MKKHILTVVLISGLVCSSLASCTLETYESTTPRSANWSVSTPTNAQTNEIQVVDNVQPAADNNASAAQQQPAAQVQQQTQQAPAQTQAQTPVTQAQAPAAQNTPAVQQPKSDPPEIKASYQQPAVAASAEYSEYVPIAKNVMNSLDMLDVIAGGSNVSVDPSNTVQDGDHTYCKVLDHRFSTVNDVINYMNTLICGDLVYRYSGLYSGETPTFKEFNGALYYLNETRGCGFGYQGEPTITNVTGGSFTFNVSIASGGGMKTFTVDAVNDGGTWKACSFNYT